MPRAYSVWPDMEHTELLIEIAFFCAERGVFPGPATIEPFDLDRASLQAVARRHRLSAAGLRERALALGQRKRQHPVLVTFEIQEMP